MAQAEILVDSTEAVITRCKAFVEPQVLAFIREAPVQDPHTDNSSSHFQPEEFNTYRKVLKNIEKKENMEENEFYTRKIPGEGAWDAITEHIPSNKISLFRMLIDNFGLEETFKHTYIIPMNGRLVNKDEEYKVNFDEL